jgi:hypothetical protein
MIWYVPIGTFSISTVTPFVPREAPFPGNRKKGQAVTYGLTLCQHDSYRCASLSWSRETAFSSCGSFSGV